MVNKLIEKDNSIILLDQDSFDPQMIFECGQAFNWKREEDGSYTIVAFDRILNVKKEGKNIILDNTNLDDFEKYWLDYFDLNTNYQEIKEEVNIDQLMNSAIEFGHGIRILNQEPFETIISFIISATNRISQIKKSISLISKTYGNFIGSYLGNDYYSFPQVDVLAQAQVCDLREICRVGFRGQRIVETSQIINDSSYNLLDLYDMERGELRELLMQLPGVGPKVADCILLFAYKKKSAFPVDVWIKRVMEYLYMDGEEIPKKDLADFGREKFGKYAGVAQQYLFYYGRENQIGK